MKITVTVMAHPKRRQHAEALYSQLAKQPFYKASITWDQKNSEWHTGKRALKAHLDGDWHIVLQDDAIIADNFYEHALAAIQHAPVKSLISFYTGTAKPFPGRVASAVRRANESNYCWLKGYLLFWGVGIAIPTDHILPMLEYIAGRREPYDTRLGYFYLGNRLPVLYTNPSLVDHDESIGTLLDHVNAEPRHAHNFISGPVLWNSDALDI